MDTGSNKSLFTLLAVVIFGIFLSLSYWMFQDELPSVIATVTGNSSNKINVLMQGTLYEPTELSDPVYIEDKDLALAITDELGLPKGQQLTLEDMQNLKRVYANLATTTDKTYHYKIGEFSITSLNGLEYATNLEELWLHGNAIADLTPIRNFNKLTVINLNHVKPLANIDTLATVTNLKTLYLSNTKVSDLTPLVNLTQFSLIYIDDIDIADRTVLPITVTQHIY